MSQKITSLQVLGAAVLITAFAFGAQPLLAEQYDKEETAALVKVLPHSKVSLADGVRQLSKGGEVATSAKFELNDDKKLSLSVYTAEKGLGKDPEHNVLKEFSGSPEQSTWLPEAEVFKDIPHVSRASEHLVLMALASRPLADFITAAQQQQKGIVFSAIPEVKNHRPVLVVLIADGDKVKEVDYDLQTGRALATR